MWCMHYYEVWVGSAKYHGESALTYSYSDNLSPGSIVVVPMMRQTVTAVVLKEVPKPKFQTKDILRSVSSEKLPPELLHTLEWLRSYYPAPLGQIAALLLPQTLSTKSRNPNINESSRQKEISLQQLTKDQTEAVKLIRKARPKNILLHGDTGTGKTRLYLELISEQLSKGQSTILLTPEIGLTPQLVHACSSAFPDKTIVMHSDLTPADRRKAWLKILESKEPVIVIGPRSALFTPVKRVGLIIIDEFHESAYKQEQAPHYLASRVAAKLAELHGAQLVLGSATPLVTDYYTFEQKKLPIIRMQEQAVKSVFKSPKPLVIDLKKRELFSRSPWLSNPLIDSMEETLQNKQQSLIFLNRRGTARLILCQVCGWEALCPRCDLPLTYHGDKHVMQCHTCGFNQKAPDTCTECGANDIIFRSIGTKSLVTELERLFPQAKISRFDSDTNKADSLEKQYSAVKDGSVDILVGTQILGKGLDLPNLSVLGVVLADTSLSFPDYTAEERTFQLLTQVIGRVNRGHTEGKAFVQTHHPDNPLLKAALTRDYQAFYDMQLKERQQYGFPPFRYLLKLTCTRATSASAKRASEDLAAKLRNKGVPIEVVGPGPAFVEKTHDRYRWQLIVKSVRRAELVKIIQDLPANWSYDIDPMNLL